MLYVNSHHTLTRSHLTRSRSERERSERERERRNPVNARAHLRSIKCAFISRKNLKIKS